MLIPDRRKKSDLFSLPIELHAQILNIASFRDLCAFRLVNTNAHYLLSKGEILRQWIGKHFGKNQLRLHTPTTSPTFQYVLEQHRRLSTATELAIVLAEYIERKILRHTLRRLDVFPDQSRGDLFATVKAQLRDQMVPLILTLQHYLEQFAASLLEDVISSQTGTRPDYVSRGRGIMASYERDTLLLTHRFWMFFCWLQNQILSRPSYVGNVERAVRGWIVEPLNPADMKLFVVLGNMRAFLQLMSLGSYKQCRKAVEAWIRQLDPERNVRWEERWQAIAPRFGEVPTKKQAEEALKLDLSTTDVWFESARDVLFEEGLISVAERNDDRVGTPWQTMDFLCEIAGYDVLHTPPWL